MTHCSLLAAWMIRKDRVMELAEVKTPEEVEVIVGRRQSERVVADHSSNPAMVSGEQYEEVMESATQGNAHPERRGWGE